ncbi:MAG: 3-isopropylmalate dehydratase large subunit [Candidatus Helarchaeota archaeon]
MSTIAEKILAKASVEKREVVKPGEYLNCNIDLAMGHIALAKVAANFMGIKKKYRKVWDNEKVVGILDHFSPAPSERWALAHQMIRKFAREQNFKYFYDIKEGICHQVLPEKGHVAPGMLIVGTDSHTTTYGAFNAASCGIGYTDMTIVFIKGTLWFRVPESQLFEINGKLDKRVMSKDIILYIAGKYGTDIGTYKSMEFVGDAMDNLSIASRMTISNMSLELGAKFGFTPPDEKIIKWLKPRTDRPLELVKPDEDAKYSETFQIEVDNLEPQVACPHSVENVKPVSEVKNVKIDQAFLGSCTNGRIEDLEIAAEILKGKRIHEDVRLIVIPASQEIWLEAAERGISKILIEAGGIIGNPNCGPCFGAHMGMLAGGENCISSSNRNFKGRMGSEKAGIYLASPATVAASALTGVITDPRDI